jgi:hypothetical protein
VTAAEVTPLDPDSEKGREVADRLSDTLARIRVAIEERRAATARAEQEKAA